ncbi:MAG TPA: hypothetical protein VGF09_02365 [Solirubrobacterales bacterium]
MLRVGLVLAASLLVAMALAATAQASQPIEFFQVETSDTDAGGHPDIRTSFTLPNAGEPEVAKDIEIKWPQGVFGNPQAVPRCTALDFGFDQCPSNSQVGWISVKGLYEGDPFHTFGVAPLYDMEPVGESETARFAFTVPTLNVPIAIPITVRTGSDYGLTLKVSGITQEIPLREADLRVWGFPAEEGHDALRFPIGSPGEPPGCPGLLVPVSGSESCPDLKTPTASGILVKPLIDNPTVCTASPLEVELRVTSYQDPVPSTAEAEYPETTKCNSEVFRPVFNVGLTTDEADAPSGLNMQLVAQQVLGQTNAPSQLRSAIVTLPEGFSINPDAADGQRSCPDADANFGNEQPSNCPDTSKIGTMEVVTPALDAPLTGGLYIGEPKPGNQYRLFMLFDGFGIHAKIAPQIFPNPQTGQLQFKVTDLPQVPFEQFNLHLFASDRGLIATPTRCTLYQTESEFIPWNDQVAPQTSTPNVSITSGPNSTSCPGAVRPFHPRLEAGTTTPIAGAFSSFILRLDRDDGDQFLGDLTFKMPPGFTGSLRGISYCSDASIAAAAQRLGREELASPSCPASSLIGSTNVAAGPGSHPFHAVGKMYLAGPFKGAPLSVAAVTPALAGPYDYGVVVVRVALHIDPQTAQVSAVSDTVPSIIGGIPIRMRSIQVNIDKPNFTINPTNCSPFTVDSQGIGDQGTVSDFSSYFQAVNCGILPFKPSMTVKQLGKRKETKRSKNPRLRFELRTRNGDANIKSVAVTLPKAFAIDQRHLGNICSKAQLEAESCAGRQAIGTVETRTPLLDQPLKGPAYAVSGFGKLPHLAFILDGQVRLIPQAESSSVKGGHLRTVVPVVPDAPIGLFKLDLYGGKQGYLVNTRDLCTAPADITVEYTAQSGKTLKQSVATKTACGKKKSKHAKRRH